MNVVHILICRQNTQTHNINKSKTPSLNFLLGEVASMCVVMPMWRSENHSLYPVDSRDGTLAARLGGQWLLLTDFLEIEFLVPLPSARIADVQHHIV